MKILILLFYVFLMASCSDGTFEPRVEEIVKKVENVKYISTSIKDGRDEKSFNQRTYDIYPDGRLLLRYMRFSSYLADVDKDLPIRVQLTLADIDQSAETRANLVICPISTSWMMGASWESPTFMQKDSWQKGGEFDESQCVSALDPESIPKMVGTVKSGSKQDQALAEWACTNDDELCFDISKWYHKYVLQGDVNNGWVLINKAESRIQVYGDSHHALGPRLQWFSTKYVWVPAPVEDGEESE